MTTARDLITLALKDSGIVGVGQTANAEDINDGLTRLNAMIAQWSRRRWLVYHLVDVVFQATGALSYTIGIGGNINTPRPDQIESGFFRQNVGVPGNQVDYPLVQIPSKENYNLIALKAMQSFPQYFFYDSGWPLGNVFIWPVPTSLYEIHLSLKATLQQVGNLSEDIDFPPEYEEALRLNLSIRLRVAYQMAPDPGLNTLAKVALNTLKNSNAQIPTLQLPSDLVRGNRPYNLFSDTNY
jgi:hypothetical protein